MNCYCCKPSYSSRRGEYEEGETGSVEAEEQRSCKK